jgi:DNA polymerase-3 subunit alpha
MKDHAALHCHADSSILDGFAKPLEYLERAVELGLKGIALTEHGAIPDLSQFMKKARDVGITPIPGCEMYVAPINPKGAKALYSRVLWSRWSPSFTI